MYWITNSGLQGKTTLILYRTTGVFILNYQGVVTGCGEGCGRIFAIIVKVATEDDIGESYVEDRMWPCVPSAMFRIWNIEDHHIPSPFMENWAIVWHMGYRYSNVTIWGIIISV